MTEVTDILIGDDNDLIFDGGDIKIGASDKQSMRSTINAWPGWWKEFPSVGVGISKYLNSSGKNQEIQRNIKLQLESDGFDVVTIIANNTPNGEFDIQANATRTV